MKKFEIAKNTADSIAKQQANAGVTLVMTVLVFGVLTVAKAVTEVVSDVEIDIEPTEL